MTYQDDIQDAIYDPPIDNILETEILSWFNFGNALKNKEDEIFFQMLNECLVYESGAQAKGSIMSTESLLMGIILNQQKMIKELMKSYNGEPDKSSRQKTVT